MIDKRVDDLQAALAGIGPGASIMISGFGNAGIPGNLLHGLSGMGLSGLTMILNAIRRLEESNPVFFAEGQIAHVITTACRGTILQKSLLSTLTCLARAARGAEIRAITN